MYRYEKAYREGQFSGLKPATRQKHRSQRLPENFEFLVEQAIQLRKEVPERSVAQIIRILELEGHVAPGVLKRPTLERHLYKRGFGREHMQMYRDARESSSKRFCKPHRMMLIQGDIKYGPKLPIGKNGAKVQTYLSSAIDDHSRYILSSRFYDNQEETIVEDTFHQAINSGSVVKTKIQDFYNELIWLISYEEHGENSGTLPRTIYAKLHTATASLDSSIQPVSDNQVQNDAVQSYRCGYIDQWQLWLL